MPGLLNVHPSSNHAGEHHATDFVFGDWLDGHTESTCVLVGYCLHRLYCGITYETGQICRPKVRIAQWGVKTDDSTDGHSGRTLVVNANGGSVANVGAVSCAARETIANYCVSGRQQSVILRCRNVQSLAWFNATRHYSIPNALKFASG